MVRKVSHGWSFRQQSESNSRRNIRLSDITKRHNSRFVFNKDKKVFLTTEQVKFLVERLEHLESKLHKRNAKELADQREERRRKREEQREPQRRREVESQGTGLENRLDNFADFHANLRSGK